MVLGRKLAWDPQIRGTQHRGILHPPIKRIGGGNGNPLQYSCLKNPMDRGAWWATVHGSQRVRHNLAHLHCVHVVCTP